MKMEPVNLTAEFSPLDLKFAALMEELSGGKAPGVYLAAALVSFYRGEGHVCIDLAALAGAGVPAGDSALSCPPLKTWLRKLRESPVVGRPGEYRPLVLDGSRLYLSRYRDYEDRVAGRLRQSAAWLNMDLNETAFRKGMERLFPSAAETDGQRTAAALSVLKRFVVISGGPGTGKTTTVARILALLLEQPAASPLRIALCAPTGKAAARLQESINREKKALDCADSIREAIPSQASTIHRLLKSYPEERSGIGSPDPPAGLLPVDVLVMDEASMVDLSLLARLLTALPPGARLILLGDKDQLASVEAGSVLADICGPGDFGYSQSLVPRLQTLTGKSPNPDPLAESSLADCIVQLRHSYRFGEESGIGAVSRMVNAGDAAGALKILHGRQFRDVSWHSLPPPEGLQGMLRDRAARGFSECLKSADPAQALKELNGFRVLCALREGPYGIRAANSAIERILSEKGLIRRDETFYRGRPVLITRNDYDLKLFNGDVGIVLPDPETGQLRAFFENPDGRIRKFPPLRLPEHETVYAMTVHKSQGSEFDEIVIILPDRASPVLTRELLYTALTRARRHAEVWARDDIFSDAVARRIERMSGLAEALWAPPGAGRFES